MAGQDYHHEDEFNAPDWLNIKLFEDIIRKSDCDKTIKVTNIDIKPAVSLSEHMASIMYRVGVTYTAGESLTSDWKSFIVKTMPFSDGMVKDLLSESKIFETESKMYAKTIPEMEELYAENGFTESFSPKMVHWCLDPYQTIIFEDMSPKGYATASEPIDFRKSKYLARKIARFHAASYVLHENNGDVKDYIEGLGSEKSFKDFQPFLKTSLNSFTKFITGLPELERYKEDFNRICDGSLLEKVNHLYRNPNESIYNVLNHGDFHIKNILWKIDGSGQAEDVKLIDLQICSYGSPAIDVFYLLYCQSSYEVRKNHRSELIYHYYLEFANALKDLNFQGYIPTLHDLHMELLRNGFFEVYMVGIFIPFVAGGMENIGHDMQEIMKDPTGTFAEDLKQKKFNAPIFRNEVIRLLPEFLQTGFF